jgi:hypothetical protein
MASIMASIHWSMEGMPRGVMKMGGGKASKVSMMITGGGGIKSMISIGMKGGTG